MKLHKLILKEMFQRNNQLISSLLAIILGIAVVVGINNITVFSEKAVANELGALGANILILPKSATVQDYYSVDYETEALLPEDYVQILTNSNIRGIDNLSPKLSMTTMIDGHNVIITGILPRSEFKSQVLWQQTLGGFKLSHGCTVPVAIPGVDNSAALARKRVIDDLSKDAVLVGSDIAARLNVKEGDTLRLLSGTFRIESILPPTGKVDDSRIFAHLRVVQDFTQRPNLLNAIEVVGCCSAISDGLIIQLNKLLPEAKVVTIGQIVQTQIKTNKMMRQLSDIMFIVILIVSCAIITNLMFANVYERRKEIGTYMALGATSGWIGRIFVFKALLVGLTGGVLGFVTGTVLAVVLGPHITGVAVYPIPILGLYSTAASTLVSLVASIVPAWKATKVDPFIILQEN